ncbi:hypothetical protein Tco_0004791 [Tanacetum coccineum]
MTWCSTLKTTISLGSCPIALLSIINICITSTPVIASKMPYFVALVAFLGARAIMVKMALGALRQRSPVRLPFTCSHIVDLGNILPLEGLLLVTIFCSCIESLASPFVVRLPFVRRSEFLIYQFVGQLNSLIERPGSGRLDVPINVVRKSTDVLVNLIGFIGNKLGTYQG